jgi:carboxyl-terminal processing protease
VKLRRSAPWLAFGTAALVGAGFAEREPLDPGVAAATALDWAGSPSGSLDGDEAAGPRTALRRWPLVAFEGELEAWDDGAAARCDTPRGLSKPTGQPPRLACDEARAVVAQARASLATPAEAIDEARFALVTSDWLDPHGLWSVAPDAPIAPLLRARVPALLRELEAPRGSGRCVAALELGEALAAWTRELRRVADAGRAASAVQPLPRSRAWELVSSTPFEDGRVSRRARDLARLLGHAAGGAEASFGAPMRTHADALVERSLPSASAEHWAEIVLAAAVRAYVPQIDPHGAWAPLDEETSIYDLDLEVDPPPRLWSDMTRTALGVRIDRGAFAPLRDGDVVLSVRGQSLAGMSVEQLGQLAVLDEATEVGPEAVVEVELLRPDSSTPTSVRVETAPRDEPPAPVDADTGLGASTVAYGAGEVLVLRIPDVPDDLGDRVADAIADAADGSPPVGILLDLRGNGGGSTDGALGALGLFLPGAALFPMRRRGGEVEVDRAPTPAPDHAWVGPVAALVDGDSASAAEMIAGALAAYRRGPVLGSRTYGKGCAQEYLDDDSDRGVLRLTTLVFSLPDGSPLQRVGVVPSIALGVGGGGEREELLPRAPLAWRGPDVRDPHLVRDVPWPSSGGRIGAAPDATIARALRSIGTPRAAAR